VIFYDLGEKIMQMELRFQLVKHRKNLENSDVAPKTTQKFNQVYSSRTTLLVLITDSPTLCARFWRCHQLATVPLLDRLRTALRALIAPKLSNSSSPISMRFLEEKRRQNFCRRLSDGFIEHDGVHVDELWRLIHLARMNASVIFD